jgi:cardiolipin synthase
VTGPAGRLPATGGFRLRAAHIPNLLCVLRILLVPPIALLLLRGQYLAALGVVFVAGLSDGLDGFLAKRYHWQSRLGGLLDPIADKLLLTTTYVALTVQGLVPPWLTTVVIGRDLVIVSGGLAYQWLVRPVQPEPSKASKLNTGTQLLFLVSVIAVAALPGVVPPERAAAVLMGLGAAVFVTTTVSGLDYVLRWGQRAAGRGR